MKQIVVKISVAALVFLGLFTSCTITMTTSKAVGEQIKLKMNADEDQKKNVWIDLNNNGKKDNGEVVTKFNEYVDYTIGSQTINLHGGVKSLDCKKNELTSLVSKNAALEELVCSVNKITTLDVSTSTELKRLLCDANQLKVLDVTKNKKLNYLNCRYNQLAVLDVSKNTPLEFLSCDGNQLAALDMSKNKELREVHCVNNKLKALDISNNKQLRYFACANNQLTKFDISRNMQLKYLVCAGNELKTLDASHSKALQFLICNNNTELTKLNVANGNNRNFSQPWSDTPTFNATNCPKLSCIKVDKNFNPNKQTGKGKKWVKDATAVYRNDGSECSSTLPPSTVPKITMTTSKAIGEKIKLKTYTEVANQAGVWIDLNNNGKKDSGESVTNFWNDEEYELKSQTITVYGKVTNLDCSRNKLTQLDVSKNTELEKLHSQDNNLTELNVRNNTKLTLLDCGVNNLTELDVRNCRQLVYLYCYVNQLTKLNTSNCTKLEGLQCYRNKLTELDVRKCRELKWLNLTNNQLKTIDLSKCKELYELYCSMNKLIILDVSGNTQLKQLLCTNNQLTVLDVSGNKSLRKFWCSNNHNLTSVNVANGHNRDFDGKYHTNPAFDAIGCSKLKCIKVDKGFDPTGLTGKKEWRKDATAVWNNSGNPCGDYTPSDNPKITFTTTKAIGEKIKLGIDANPTDQAGVWIDLNNNGVQDNGEAVTTFGGDIEYTIGAHTVTLYGKVKMLNCFNNNMIQLNLTQNTQLKELNCNFNQLEILDVSKNTELKRLYCNNNKLTQLDISNNTKLTYLNCITNQIEDLDVNIQLKELWCHYNQLKVLDISASTGLEYLYCNNNKLTQLDISNNTKLINLRCNNNQLRDLDVSASTKLTYLNCNNNNKLKTINVTNGNNSNFKTIYDGDTPAFDATHCPQLTCIKVDNGFNPAGQTGTGKKWKKDSGASYINDGSDCN